MTFTKILLAALAAFVGLTLLLLLGITLGQAFIGTVRHG